jgi:hypothetical protein
MHPFPGDNTSAIGWLFASSKFALSSPAHRAHLAAGRTTAGNRPLTEKPLPGLSAPKEGSKRGRSPAQFCVLQPIEALPTSTRPPVQLRTDTSCPQTLAHTDKRKFCHLLAPQKILS